MRVRTTRLAVVLLAVATSFALAAPAQARYIIGPTVRTGDADITPAVVLKATVGAGESFGGLEAPHTFNPLDGYPPAGHDTTGFTPVPSGFGGVILGLTSEGATVSLYCIDHNTDTEAGIGYDPGAWDLTGVRNLGYVLRILQTGYPATGEPATAPTNNRRAAAVQAAIWFFTDRFVLATGDARFALTSQIVHDALAAGRVAEPHPSLTVAGPATADPGVVTGPYTVHGTAGHAVLHVSHGELFTDAQAERPIASGATVPVGEPFWLRAPQPAVARITATAVAENPIGRAFLYAPTDPDNPAPARAQRLILALAGQVRTTAHLDVAVCTPEAGEGGGQAGESAGCSGVGLAQTGVDIWPLTASGSALLAVGLVTAMAARRRRALSARPL